MLESFPYLSALSPILCLFAKTVISALNKHSELAEKRSSNEWQCAVLPRLFSSHLHLSLHRLENQWFATPVVGFTFADALTRLLFTRFYPPPPLFVSETFSSARLTDARYAKVSVVLAAYCYNGVGVEATICDVGALLPSIELLQCTFLGKRYR